MARFLAIDVGTRRVGTAVSDDGGTFALPSDVLDATTAVKLITQRAQDEAFEALVIGLPVDLKGREGLAARRSRAFATKLQASLDTLNIPTPLTFVDERLTTVVADHLLDEAGVHGKQRKEQVDAIAAQQILQVFLDGRRTGRGGDAD